MIIFIPVLVICMNGACEFMQTKTYYQTQSQCRDQIDAQKQHMRNIAEKGKGKIEYIEGTCIDADVKTRTRTERDA
jgi:hypothetical protein